MVFLSFIFVMEYVVFQNFSDYENEVKIPDILTLTYLLERIGYIPRGLIVYISKDSKRYIDWYLECNKKNSRGRI